MVTVAEQSAYTKEHRVFVKNVLFARMTRFASVITAYVAHAGKSTNEKGGRKRFFVGRLHVFHRVSCAAAAAAFHLAAAQNPLPNELPLNEKCTGHSPSTRNA